MARRLKNNLPPPISIHPASEAAHTIIRVMRSGSKKDGDGDAWKRKSRAYHLHKAARHILSYLIDGNEYHLENALTRVAFALCLELK